MRIGVIGGSGFIGSHVVDALVTAGHEVTVFDIMKPHRPDVHHVFVDITDLSKTTVAMTEPYDAVYMLAAMADVNHVHTNPVESVEVNILAVANVLEACRRIKARRLILASTVWVYEAAREAQPDEDTALAAEGVKHLYTASKISAELLCHAYQRLYGVDFTILRYGIPYGPRARGPTVISAFFRKALAGEPLQLHGSGEQYRSFIYVEDLAAGNVAALQEAARNKIYNLDGPRSVTIREVAENVKRIIGGKVVIEMMPARPGDFGGKILNNDRARADLGWAPKVDIEAGMEAYHAWLRAEEGAR